MSITFSTPQAEDIGCACTLHRLAPCIEWMWPGWRYKSGFVVFMDDSDPVRIPVTDVLDLHSVPARDAQAVVEEYLIEARRLGFRALRIVHGRGIGVRREMVRKILARTDFVTAFADAPPEAGGWGATTATLS